MECKDFGKYSISEFILGIMCMTKFQAEFTVLSFF